MKDFYKNEMLEEAGD